jgi:hypothetical protein
MSKAHPDYSAAITHLKAIYGKIIQGSYKKPEDYVASMEKWIKRWSDPDLATSDNALEALVELGKYHTILSLTALTCQGCRMRGETPKKRKSAATPIVTEGIAHTARLQTEGWVLKGLFDIKYVPGKQGTMLSAFVMENKSLICAGTSPVESFNNFVQNYRPRSQGHASLETIKMSLSMTAFQYNIR